MDVVGLQKHEQDEIFKMLAIILWLGNMVFAEDDNGNAAISDPDGVCFLDWFEDSGRRSKKLCCCSRELYCLSDGGGR